MVTVSAAGSSLTAVPSCTTTFTVLPLPGNTGVIDRGMGASHSSHFPSLGIAGAGGSLRYFIDGPASVSFELFNAGGRVLQRIPASQQIRGWHPLRLFQGPNGGFTGSKGVYFIRCGVNGTYGAVKRIVAVR
jgi:hypothetical protein